MKKIFLFTLILTSSLIAKSYEAILQPIETISIYAEAAGSIKNLNQNNELKNFNGLLCTIDNEIDKKQLLNNKEKLKLLEKIANIKKSNYEKVASLSGKNIKEIENYHIDYLNTMVLIQDLKNNIDSLEDKITKKHFYVKNKYIKSLFVSNDEFVNIGTKLYELEDHSMKKLIFYITEEDLKVLQNNNNFKIDGFNEKDFKINKISKSVDEKYLSLYKIELTTTKDIEFGRKIKIII